MQDPDLSHLKGRAETRPGPNYIIPDFREMLQAMADTPHCQTARVRPGNAVWLSGEKPLLFVLRDGVRLIGEIHNVGRDHVEVVTKEEADTYAVLPFCSIIYIAYSEIGA